MGIFSSKETKAENYLAKRGLEGLDPAIMTQVARIQDEMRGNGITKVGASLTFGSSIEGVQASYLSAIAEQNWILMKQNDDIIKELKKLNAK